MNFRNRRRAKINTAVTVITKKPRIQNHSGTMATSSNIFRVTGPSCGEITGENHRWNHLTKASDAELWYFLWSAHWINGWVNNREAGDLRRHLAQYDVIVMNAPPPHPMHLVHQKMAPENGLVSVKGVLQTHWTIIDCTDYLLKVSVSWDYSGGNADIYADRSAVYIVEISRLF